MYLVEAADDICYTIDFEDGINLGLVSEDFALEYLIKLSKTVLTLPNTKHLRPKKTELFARLSNRKFNQRCREGFVENEPLFCKENFLMP
jgi:dGTPase